MENSICGFQRSEFFVAGSVREMESEKFLAGARTTESRIVATKERRSTSTG